MVVAQSLGVHDFNKNIHSAATNHTLLARFVGGERKVVQFRRARSHRRFRLRPNFRLDTAAAHRSRYFAVLKEEHLGTALLWRRSAGVGDSRNHHTLTALAGFVDHAIEIALGNRRHPVVTLFFKILRLQCTPSRSKEPSVTPKITQGKDDGYFPQH